MQSEPPKKTVKIFFILITVMSLLGLLVLAQDGYPWLQQSENPVVPLVNSPTPAIHISIWWNPQIAERDLQLVHELGFGWVKQRFPWREIQGAGNGPYDWYRSDIVVDSIEQAGLKIIARLDSQPFWTQADNGERPLMNAPPADLSLFGDYCEAIAERYEGRIAAYQVWNEPNLAREWGEQPPDPQGYVALLAECYQGIKTSDPNAIVISAGLAPTGTGAPVAMPDEQFLRAMYEAGASDYFDMLGVHAAGFKAEPHISPDLVAADPDLGGNRWMSFRHVEDYRDIMVEYGDSAKQIAILEMGWTTDEVHPEYSWFAVSEEQQAENLVGAYWWAYQNWQPWIGFMTTIYLADPVWTEEDEQYWWSISYPDFPTTRVRGAFDALSNLPDSWAGGGED